MSIRRYFKPVSGLPDPRGRLSQSIPPAAIAEANRLVQEAAQQSSAKSTSTKRRPYKTYHPADRLKIAKYACDHGVAAAARFFSKKLKDTISESTVRSIRDSYKRELKAGKRSRDDDSDEELSTKKRGRPFLLGKDIDEKVQLYLKKTREGGGTVSARGTMAAARGIVLKLNHSLLAEFGGPVTLCKPWAQSLLRRMGFVRRKVTTAKSKHNDADFAKLEKSFLADVVSTVAMEDIPLELIFNWDQTGIKLVPCSSWTMEKRGVRRVEVVGATDKRQITAVFCGTLLGEFLPVQVIYAGRTSRCHPRHSFPCDWHITHSRKHWSTEETMLDYIKLIILPYVERVRYDIGNQSAAALAIFDNFKGQITSACFSLLEENNIHYVLLPANTTDKLQPLDVAVNKPAKDFIRRKFEEWYSQQVMEQLDGVEMDQLNSATLNPIDLGMAQVKEVGAKWMVEMADYIGENPQFVINGFIRSGITGALDGTIEEEDSTIDLSEETDSEFAYESEEQEDEFAD